MKKSITTLFLFIVVTVAAFADGVKFTANAPKSVAVNQQFRLTYVVNSGDVSEPSIPDIEGFDILVGPSSSRQTSMSSINGKVTHSSSVTFTYILMATKEGEFTLPAATINVDGQKITSNSLKIKVVPGNGSSNSSNVQQNTQNRQGAASVQHRASTDISNDDLFVLATLNKTNVYEQEAVLLTYKVYSRVNLVSLDTPMPDLKDFNTQEISLPQNRQSEVENYKGQLYETAVWRQFVLFPQKSGQIEIPSLTFESVVAVQTRRSLDPFEMMFSGGAYDVEVKRKLRTNKLVLNVKELPAGNSGNFSGAVGKFDISASLNKDAFKTNEEFTLKVTVKGTGNMKLMGNPQINFPSGLYVFDPVIDNKFSLSSRGFTGERVYEYVITPKVSGEQVIPSAEFTYFDTSAGVYKTVKTQPFTINVAKGKDAVATASGTYIAKEKGELLANDIRHIKLGKESNGDKGNLYASPFHLLFYISVFVLFLLSILVYRKRMADNANVTLMRTKKASKVAVARLKSAKKLMDANDSNGFYDEILKAHWGYMGDKLGIPVSRLTKETVSSELLERNVDADIVSELNDVLNECEFARYAPGDPAATMDKIYRQSIDVISKMENRIKK